MTLPKILGGAGALILSALVGGTLISSAMATDQTADPSTDGTADGTPYCQVFRDALAAELGVTTDDLVTAGKAAANAAIDAAVAAGDLDEDRAATLRERIDAFDGDCAGIGRGFGLGFGMGFERGMDHGLHLGHLQAAADALGTTPPELRTALTDAGSLQAVADAEGVSYDTVKTAVLDDVKARLDAAVADGRDQDRADTALENVTTWLDGGGQLDELPGAGFGPGHGRGHGGMGQGMGHGRGHGFGPWGGDDTDSGEEDAGS